MPSDNFQCKIADIIDRYEAQLKQEALYIERQAKTGGNEENTPYYRGVSSSLNMMPRVILTFCSFQTKSSSTSIVHEALWTQLLLLIIEA